MISTQRLIMTCIMLSLMISISSQIHTGINQYLSQGTTIDASQITNVMNEQQINELDTSQDVFNNESLYGGINTENPVQENQPFNVMSWGKTLWDVIFYTFIPWPLPSSTGWNAMEKNALTIINWFRAILIVLMYIEIFMIWRNKKNS